MNVGHSIHSLANGDLEIDGERMDAAKKENEVRKLLMIYRIQLMSKTKLQILLYCLDICYMIICASVLGYF